MRPFATAMFLIVSARGILAQPPGTLPSFEVSTIKRSSPDARDRSLPIIGARFMANNHTLKECIGYAYNLTPKLISGGPAWIGSDRYDIVGAGPSGAALHLDQAPPMFQTLLTDRFKLKFHRAEQPMSVYNLALGRNGPKLKETVPEPGKRAELIMRPSAPRVLTLPARNITIAGFVSLLEWSILDRPVIDRTGLTGRYDFDLEWKVDGTQTDRGPVPPGADSNDKPDIFSAIRELGLRLEPARTPVEVLVIDHVERPDEN
jgi:uncharacterized protein (TIGR03435 family)